MVDMEGVMVDMEEDIEEDMVEDTGDDLSDNLNSLTAFDLLFLYFKITWCWFAHFMLNIGMNIVHSSAHFCSTTNPLQTIAAYFRVLLAGFNRILEKPCGIGWYNLKFELFDKRGGRLYFHFFPKCKYRL